MTLRFRTKVFLAAFAAALLTAIATTGLVAWSLQRRTIDRLERSLVAEARLVAELLAATPALPADALDEEADRMARLGQARVTFIAADGRVVGDSTADGAELAALENHANRPEVAAVAGQDGPQLVRRFSTTTGQDTMYVALPVSHPSVGVVRLALPLTELHQQVREALSLAALGLAVAVPVALLLSWAISAPLRRRLDHVGGVARRYARGDLPRPPGGYGDDELGDVARALDGAVQELGTRMAQLAHDRTQLQAILSGMVEGVLVLDRQGRLVMANQAARGMLRLDDTAIGRRYQEWVRQPEIFAQMTTALGGQAAEGTELVLARDPSRTCVARAAPTGMEGGAVLVLHDITDLRRADRVRRDFVANVSHELRTPLTAIRGYVEALMDDPPPPTDRQRFLEIIARHTARMERLVRDLLRLARLDAGQETTELAPCDLSGLVQGVIHELEATLAARGSTVRTSLAPEVRSLVTDPAKLHDVLRNLVENGVNYSPDGSTVVVEGRRADGAVELRILDQGPGIPPGDLRRVFERFYRVDKSRTRDPGGTGIGLAIVKHLVELLDGDVSADNRPEGGAVFTIRLPAPAA